MKWRDLAEMTRRNNWTVLMTIALLTVACTQYFLSTNLANLSPGWTRQKFLEYFDSPPADPPILRAAKKEDNGDVIEVFTLNLIPRKHADSVPYWFVFVNATLRQWGQPDDWQSVAATYNINFNPRAVIRDPLVPGVLPQ